MEDSGFGVNMYILNIRIILILKFDKDSIIKENF